jgi:hypothetical protein
MRVNILTLAIALAATAAFADKPQTYETSPLAEAFGSAPVMWGLKISPDGTKISLLQMTPLGVTFAQVFDFVAKKARPIVAGKANEFDVSWCDWANDSRLLCGVGGSFRMRGGTYVAATRLIAVNPDGTDQRVLLERRYQDRFSQFEDQIVDWLPDELTA